MAQLSFSFKKQRGIVKSLRIVPEVKDGVVKPYIQSAAAAFRIYREQIEDVKFAAFDPEGGYRSVLAPAEKDRTTEMLLEAGIRCHT